MKLGKETAHFPYFTAALPLPSLYILNNWKIVVTTKILNVFQNMK